MYIKEALTIQGNHIHPLISCTLCRINKQLILKNHIFIFTAFSIILAHSSPLVVENVHIKVPSLETGNRSSTTIYVLLFAYV